MTRDRWALALIGLGVGVVGGIAAVLLHDFGGDASIYLSYARNASDGHPFSYNPGEFSSGSTSPLWALLLSLPFLAGGEALAAKALAALFMALALLGVWAAAARVARSPVGAAIGAFYTITAAALFALQLYESALVLGLIAASVWLGDRLLAKATGGAPLTVGMVAPLAATWAALPLARPDAAPLIPLQIACLLVARPGNRLRDLRTLLGAAGLSAVPALCYFGYSWAELGTPSTSSEARSFALREQADRLGPLYFSTDALRFLVTPPFWYAIVPGLAGLALALRDRDRRWIGLYGLGAIASYVVLLTFVTPGFYDTVRYMLPIAPFVVIGIAMLVEAASRSPLHPLVLILGAVLVVRPAFEVLVDDAPRLRDVPATFDNTINRDAAAVVNRVAAPGSSVLAYEVQVRYGLRDDLDVLSLDGITDGKVVEYAERRDLDGFLMRYRPRYWIADTSTEPPAPGVVAREYLQPSVLSRAVLRFREDPALEATELDGIRFRILARREDPLPYAFGPWTKVFELSYAGG